jgi:TM2 domain-containing membrane protein YozV
MISKAPLAVLHDLLITLPEKIGENEFPEILTITIISLLAVYFIALLFSKTTRCIIIRGWPDLICTVLPELLIGFVFIFNLFIAAHLELSPIEFDNVLLNIVFSAAIIVTLVISVVSNLKNSGFPVSLLYILISIIGKLMVMIMTGLFLAFFIMAALGRRKTVQEYRETKDRRRTRMTERERSQRRSNFMMLLLVTGLATLSAFMISSLIKTPSKETDTGYSENEEEEEAADDDDDDDDVDVDVEDDEPAYQNTPEKRKLNSKWLTTLVLGILTGWLGVHRFYNGKIITGILMLLTCGGFFVWQLIDVILILAGQFKDKNGARITMHGPLESPALQTAGR